MIEYWGSFRNGVLVDELNHTVECPVTLRCLAILHSSLISDSRVNPCPQFKPICKGWLLTGKRKAYHAFDQKCTCASKCTPRCASKCRFKGKMLDGHELWHSIVTRNSIRMFTDGKRTFTNGSKLSSAKGEQIGLFTTTSLLSAYSFSCFFLFYARLRCALPAGRGPCARRQTCPWLLGYTCEGRTRPPNDIHTLGNSR